MDNYDLLKEELLLRGFSPRTIKSYTYHITDFINYCKKYSPEKKREYILYLISKGYERASVRLASASIDFYVRIMLKQEPIKVPLPKKKKQLPKVLLKKEIKKMIDSLNNIKHKPKNNTSIHKNSKNTINADKKPTRLNKFSSSRRTFSAENRPIFYFKT
ncbi:phage integrase N-terminal SAM-like domain-containing protein [Candidatus Woesearchaeota archaeon]|nr:phage integrase N-terminal SAM-like domain-containing protein [Candidatus Woesearchaeota archaeon]